MHSYSDHTHAAVSLIQVIFITHILLKIANLIKFLNFFLNNNTLFR